VNHRALRRSEGTFALALGRDLLELLARGEKSRALAGPAGKNEATKPLAQFQHRPQNDRNNFKQSGQSNERSKGKPAKK